MVEVVVDMQYVVLVLRVVVLDVLQQLDLIEALLRVRVSAQGQGWLISSRLCLGLGSVLRVRVS